MISYLNLLKLNEQEGRPDVRETNSSRIGGSKASAEGFRLEEGSILSDSIVVATKSSGSPLLVVDSLLSSIVRHHDTTS